MDWSLERLKGVGVASNSGHFEMKPVTEREQLAYAIKPEIFSFEAISVGDDNGQCFLVPLDDSGIATAELIIRALKAYNGE